MFKVTLPTSDPMDRRLLGTMESFGIQRSQTAGEADGYPPPFEEYEYRCGIAGALEIMIERHWGFDDGYRVEEVE